MGAELKKKVVRNGLKLLQLIQEGLEYEEICKLISEYSEYVEEVIGSGENDFKLKI